MNLKPVGEIVELAPPEELIGTIVVDAATRKENADLTARTYYLTESLRTDFLKVLKTMAEKKGQAFWLQGGFGSGKSHFLAFLKLVLTEKSVWRIIEQKEEETRKVSDKLSQFSGLVDKKFLVVSLSLRGLEGKGALADLVLDKTKAAYESTRGEPLVIGKDERLVEFFKKNHIDNFKQDFAKFLQEKKAPKAWDSNVAVAAKLIAEFYSRKKIRPELGLSFKESFEIALSRIKEKFYGVVYLIDELSEFLREKTLEDKTRDEGVLNSIADDFCPDYPVWFFVSAQQAYEERDKHRKLRGLGRFQDIILHDADFREIVLRRVKKRVKDIKALHEYYSYYKFKFPWVRDTAEDDFFMSFPFHRDAIEETRKITSKDLPTNRAGIEILYDALSCNLREIGLVTLDNVFDEMERRGILQSNFRLVFNIYEEDKARLEVRSKENTPRKLRILKALVLINEDISGRASATSEALADMLMEQVTDDSTIDENQAFCRKLLRELKDETRHIHYENGEYSYRLKEAVSIDDDLEEEVKECKDRIDDALKQAFRINEASINAVSFLSDFGLEEATKITTHWRNMPLAGKLHIIDFAQFDPSRIDPVRDDIDFEFYLGFRNADVSQLVGKCTDPRTIVWVPRALTDKEQQKLVTYLALTNLVKRYDEKGEKAKKELAERERRSMAFDLTVLVKNIFSEGVVRTKDLDRLSFALTTLDAAIKEIVVKPLEVAYEENRLEFEDTRPWDNRYAVDLINGIVKEGILKPEAKRSFLDATRNYGKKLGIADKANPLRLDVEDCEYIKLIEEMFVAGKEKIDIDDVYRKLRDLPYGIPERIIQTYLCAMVKKGKISVGLKEGPLLTSSNIGQQEFKTTILDSFSYVIKTKIPEDWTQFVEFASVVCPAIEREPTSENVVGAVSETRKFFETEKGQLETRKDQLLSFIKTIERGDEISNRWFDLLSFAFSGQEYEDTRLLLKTFRKNFADPEQFKEEYAKYGKIVEFLTTEREAVIRAFRYCRAIVPEGLERLARAQKELNKSIAVPAIIFDEGALHELKKRKKAFLDDYKPFYTKKHNEFYEKLKSAVALTSELKDGPEMNCLKLLDKIERLGAGSALSIAASIESFVEANKLCELDPFEELKYEATCKCGFEPGRTLDVHDFLKDVISNIVKKVRTLQSSGFSEFLAKERDAKLSRLLDADILKEPSKIVKLVDQELVKKINEILDRADMTSIELDLHEVWVGIAAKSVFRLSEIDDFLESLKAAIEKKVSKIRKDPSKVIVKVREVEPEKRS